MLKEGVGTYSRQQSPSTQQMQTLNFEAPNSFVLKERDVLSLTERTDIWINTISAINTIAFRDASG
jgi:hypothetical protein